MASPRWESIECCGCQCPQPREESLITLLVAPELRPVLVIPRLKNKTAVYAGRVVTKVKDSDIDAVVCVPT